MGSCEVCARPLCVACAVPVRGTLVGPECLATVLEHAPPPEAIPEPVPPRGGKLILVGFAVVVVASFLPWSRFGADSGFLGAWRFHWSLLAVAAGALGLLVALYASRRPLRERWESATQGVLGFAVLAGALMHAYHPPPLSSASAAPWVAVGGAALVLTGAWRKRRGAARRALS